MALVQRACYFLAISLKFHACYFLVMLFLDFFILSLHVWTLDVKLDNGTTLSSLFNSYHCHQPQLLCVLYGIAPIGSLCWQKFASRLQEFICCL